MARFDDAISALDEISAEAGAAIKITVDLTTDPPPIAHVLSELAEPGLEISVIHRPDVAAESESKFVRDLLGQLADRA